MAKVMNYTRTRIELLQKQGLQPAEILRLSKTEGLAVSLASVVTRSNQIRKRLLKHKLCTPQIFFEHTHFLAQVPNIHCGS